MLASVGYDKAKHILEVQFNHGRIYQYFDVPASVFKELMAAESLGSYYNSEIRDGGYDYMQVR